MATRVRICRGEDCAKRRGATKKLKELLAESASLDTIKCQDICEGPVVVVGRKKERFWFKKVRGNALRQDLLTFLHDGSITAQLACKLAKKK